MTYCEKIVARRRELSLTQGDMAKYLEISRQAYSLYETGKRKISFETALKIGEILDISLDELGLNYRSSTSKDDIDDTPLSQFSTLSQREQDLVSAYRLLDDRQKDVIDYQIRTFAEFNEYKLNEK